MGFVVGLAAHIMLRQLLILPRARRWVSRTIFRHMAKSRAVADLRFDRLDSCCSAELLRFARVVVVPRVPQPPLEQWGVRDAGAFTAIEAAGITLREMIFVRADRVGDASLLFHELVHVVQWRTLGPNRFLALYGLLLLEHGYRGNPLEEMAYDLQARFDAGETLAIDAIVARRTQELFAGFAKRSWPHRCVFAAIR